MAIQEHVEVVKQGAAAIEQWRARNPDTRLDLYGANLSEADLSGADLREAYLCEADLCKVDLSGADLYGANLSEADLSGANLYGANPRGANLSGANLRGANLSGANLYLANLRGADLYGANLRGADLYGANLREAYLRGANLSGARAIWSCGPGGSRDDMCYFVRHDRGLMVNCGCFWDTLAEFEAEVEETHGDNEYGRYYRAVIEAAGVCLGICCRV
jgi:uncharacterized protein YjbI with pentapeptide repeats